MRIVVWGLPLHSHTHSYIHYAFSKASQHMGFETYWVPDDLEHNQLIDENSLVICCGISDKNLKAVKGAKYILHNSDRDDIRAVAKSITLQVYTHDVLTRNVEKLSDLTFWESSTKTLYQPWATDLVPKEIKEIDPIIQKENFNVNWVGSVTDGEHGNISELQEYAKFCEDNNLKFTVSRLASADNNVSLIRKSRHSPALQGKWQVEKGYIPCRIFKNISYGCWSLTNSSTTASLLELEDCPSVEKVFIASENFITNGTVSMIKDKMKLVSDKHTYINRLNTIIKCIQ